MDCSTKAGIDKVSKVLAVALAVFLCCFELFTAYFGTLQGLNQMVLHLALACAIGFLIYQPSKKDRLIYKILNLIFAAAILVSLLYIFVNNKEILKRLPQITPVLKIQIILGTAALLLILELTRRTLGWALPVLAIVFILYALFGSAFSGMLYHKSVPYATFIEQVYLTTSGIFGEPVKICATYVFLFILFGSFLDASGAGEFFIEFSKSLVGKFRGGPGLMAVVSSALMGTISGSSVANVATTGVFTIPLMKKTGYKSEFAGAVESVASTGGQILPPVMGAGAFIMAELVGTSYAFVIKCAIIPAVLYFFTVFIQVYLEARKMKLPGIPQEEIKPLKQILVKQGYLSIPLIAIIVMLVKGYSPMRSGFYGVIMIIVVSMFNKKTRMTPRKICVAMYKTAKSIAPVASACACAGIVICVVSITGIGLKFSSAILSLSNGNLVIALLLAMCSSLVLGMGLPTTASYIIQATLVAPALITMGLLPIQAHLFVFYFACIAVITPPVALAAYTAAPICQGNPMKVGLQAFRLGLAAFIVPFAFAFGQGLLLIGDVPTILVTILTAILGCSALAVGLTGWLGENMSLGLRALLTVGAVCLVIPGVLTDFVGLGITVVACVTQMVLVRKGRGMKSEAVKS